MEIEICYSRCAVAGIDLRGFWVVKERLDPLGLLMGCFASRWVKYRAAFILSQQVNLYFFTHPQKNPLSGRLCQVGKGGGQRQVSGLTQNLQVGSCTRRGARRDCLAAERKSPALGRA
ncbi:hypothetical protein I9H06_16540 [Pseudomonas tremae]|uniref:hypothetical protein n=1 Tax=Pseudomonas tremae TaxID=200454 RepID=UPI001F46AAB6|nr:hypothetical protein [Pseudomonas tremae]MCF5715530.1 hypothetical protein [Pseudomonas tremae]UQB29974.1 hypothetical protein I9H06_16540 [Pseudomonas tremae]